MNVHLVAPPVFASVLGIVVITVYVSDLYARIVDCGRRRKEPDTLGG